MFFSYFFLFQQTTLFRLSHFLPTNQFSVRSQQKEMDISNLEEFAKENYDIAKDELGVNCTPKDLYNRTTSMAIDSEIIPRGPMYKNGCYIYLTGDKIDKDLQIDWGEESETE